MIIILKNDVIINSAKCGARYRVDSGVVAVSTMRKAARGFQFSVRRDGPSGKHEIRLLRETNKKKSLVKLLEEKIK